LPGHFCAGDSSSRTSINDDDIGALTGRDFLVRHTLTYMGSQGKFVPE
jgi:hypothetical protein